MSNESPTPDQGCNRHMWFVVNQRKQARVIRGRSVGMRWLETLSCRRCGEYKKRWIKEATI